MCTWLTHQQQNLLHGGFIHGTVAAYAPETGLPWKHNERLAAAVNNSSLLLDSLAS